jgi:hypothetical protein
MNRTIHRTTLRTRLPVLAAVGAVVIATVYTASPASAEGHSLFEEDDAIELGGGKGGKGGGDACPSNPCAPGQPATNGACPAPERTTLHHNANCSEVTAPAIGNYASEKLPGKRFQCGPSTPHYPCIPTALNGGNCSHTHTKEKQWNLTTKSDTQCCFAKEVEVGTAACDVPSGF